METFGQENERVHYSRRTVFYIIAMSFGSISFGYASSIIATTLGQPSFLSYMNLVDNPDQAHIMGAMNSLFYVGGFFGAIFNSWSADRFGRKTSIIIGCAMMIVASALCAGSVDIEMFIVFRFFTGWSCLMLLITVPLWITEVVPPHGRGMLAEIHGLMAILGYFIAGYVGVGFFYYHPAGGTEWRAPLALACFWPILTLSLIPFLPESPRWLISRGKTAEALRIVERLHRKRGDNTADYARAEFTQIQKQVEFDMRLDSSWRVILTRPSYRKRALIACSILGSIYSSGTLTVTNYGPTLYKGLGFSDSAALQFQAASVGCSILGILLSLCIVERIPRHIMLGGGLYVVAVPMAVLAAVTARYVGTDNHAGLATGVAMIYCYFFLYCIFLDGPGYFYASEIFPTHLRAKGTTICMASYALVNILWTQVAPTAFQHIGWRFYIVFICCCLVMGAVMLLFYPNTLNKPLEEVAALFGDVDLVAMYSADVTIEHEDDVESTLEVSNDKA